MGIFDFFQKKTITDFSQVDGGCGFLAGLVDDFGFDINPLQAYSIFNKSSELEDAISRIAEPISSLVLGLAINRTDIDYKADIIKLLNNPGEGMTKSQFWTEISENFSLTNEIFIVGRGNVTNAPLALCPIRPYDVMVNYSETDGFPTEIITNCNKDRRTYYRKETDGNLRFIDNNGLNEIFYIIGNINTNDNWRGRSKLNQLCYDVLNNKEGKRHNLSLIKNGLRTTGILSPKQNGTERTNWDGSKVKEIENHVRKFNQGAGNAGNVLIIGTPTEINGITQNNKDMDFVELLRESKEAIYNSYKIPLALVLPDSMTLDNYKESIRALYDFAVIPVFNKIADGLIFNLSARFNLPEGSKIVFDEMAIRALRPVLVENMKIANETGLISVDEGRKIGGYEPTLGGNVILVDANKLPLSSVSTGLIDNPNASGE